MALPTLTNTTARRIFLERHLLSSRPSGSGHGANLLSLIETLGFVQLDSVKTVARAHDMILFARRNRYRPDHLRLCYERRKDLFEHWTHDAAVIPKSFYPHWLLRFDRDAERLKTRWSKWREPGFQAEFETVLTHIRNHGPVCSADLAPKGRRKSGGWWDWHPSKTALEFLWRTGALAVSGRRGFQKVYDLTERVIDETLRSDRTRPTPEETIDWKCNGAIDRLGFATSGEIAAFWDTVTAAEARAWCRREREAGRLLEANITDATGQQRRTYLRPETCTESPPEPIARMRILSPFDPAIRNRARTERLFGFHYRIEIFTPAPKREYGYYVFPLLEGDTFVGRVDLKAEPATGTLVIDKLWPEAGIVWGKGRIQKFQDELERLARFAGLTSIRFQDNWFRQS